jgi:hypothetical protein
VPAAKGPLFEGIVAGRSYSKVVDVQALKEFVDFRDMLQHHGIEAFEKPLTRNHLM